MTVDWRGWTLGQWVLRALLVLGPLIALAVRARSLGATPLWLDALVLVLAAGWALAPESVVGSVVLVLVALTWADGERGGLGVEALAAAAALVTAHVASVVLSYGPQRLPVPPAVARLWAVRGAVLWSSACAVWVVGRLVADLPTSGTVWVAGLGVALSVIVVAVAALQSLVPQEER